MSINKLENFVRTENRQRTHREQTENSKPEATLILVDSRGERANNLNLKLCSIMRRSRQCDYKTYYVIGGTQL